MSVAVLLVIAALGAVGAMALSRSMARRHARERLAVARAESSAAVRGARLSAQAARRAAETAAREESLELRARADAEITASVEKMARREERLAARDAELAEEIATLDAAHAEIDERHQTVKSLRDRAAGLRRDAEERAEQALAELERKAGITAAEVRERLVARWTEEARAASGQVLRSIEPSDPVYDREARRVMDIASSRYKNHFLTERNRSNIKVGAEVCQVLTDEGRVLLTALESAANIQLHVNEDGDAVRLEGLDGVGREVARRALNRLMKKPQTAADARKDPMVWAQRIRDNLEREIRSLGKKAFSVLEIPRPHVEIVDLVGALNYRTSYTQNQWLHAVEASFLAGMMASEMGLDVKLARRATLMHDIGKALTHKIEGSHAVIGADIARRLGEDEIVANAIGAHHADEPPGSVYAYLVAAADAMSGARPGARREATEGFSTKVEDLERIGMRYRGVERAHAVHGGRELRVYVREREVSDLEVVNLSEEIAGQISEEMTFPGQIKVTIIRSFEAVSTAS